MAEKEYAVIVKRGINLQEVDADLAASTGAGPIPNRTVDVANPRLGSKRMTHWMLTDEEAEALRSDERILAVEIPPDQRDDIQIGLRASQAGQFFRGLTDANDINWGLRRCIDQNNDYFINNDGTIDGDYNYAVNGSGVDIVIQDSGIQPNHPEWEDSQGNSRLQQIDWYTESGLTGTQSVNHYRDRDGHGTHCAGIAAGKTYGWAKESRIYSQKLDGLETLNGSDGTGIPVADAFDAIRLWHNSKNGSRPTVVNMSWGYLVTTPDTPTGGEYRGTPWNYTTETDAQLLQTYGIIPPYGDGQRRLPVQVAFADAEIEDMIDDGIHVCIAAGNDYYKADTSTGVEYDNFVTINGVNRFYHRPGSPYSTRAFYVGNVDSAYEILIQFPNVYEKEAAAESSKKGPAVNIWAPGTNIMSTSSNEADGSYTLYDYPDNSNYKIMSIGGTSMASPQVAGLCALYLQVYPNINPDTLRRKILNESRIVTNSAGSAGLYETTDSDYNNFRSLLGSTNRFMLSKYGVNNPYSIAGAVNLTAANFALNK